MAQAPASSSPSKVRMIPPIRLFLEAETDPRAPVRRRTRGPRPLRRRTRGPRPLRRRLTLSRLPPRHRAGRIQAIRAANSMGRSASARPPSRSPPRVSHLGNSVSSASAVGNPAMTMARSLRCPSKWSWAQSSTSCHQTTRLVAVLWIQAGSSGGYVNPATIPLGYRQPRRARCVGPMAGARGGTICEHDGVLLPAVSPRRGTCAWLKDTASRACG